MTVAVGSRWAGNTREVFTVLAIWNPNEQQDPWVQYRNQDDREYTCRLEAFECRFTPLANPA